MKLTLQGRTSFLHLVLVAVLAVTVVVSAQEGAGDDKYAKLKQTRSLLKAAITDIDSGTYAPALVALDSVLALDPANADAYYYKGLATARAGDTAGAIALLSEGTSAAPLSSRLKVFLARLYLSTGEVDLAAGLIDAVLAIKPREGEARYLKGLTQLSQGDTSGAATSFEKALEIALPGDGK